MISIRGEEDVAFHARSLDCIHCGLCLAVCPTYAITAREDASPRGRLYLMRAVAEKRLEPQGDYARTLDQCLVCRACETSCPSGVHFGAMMEVARDAHKRREPPRGRAALLERCGFALLSRPRALDRCLALLRLYQRSGLRWLVRSSGLLRLLAPRLAESEQLLPEIPPASQRRPLLERYPAHGQRRATVGLLEGCVHQPLLPEINHATIRVLNDQGFDVVVPRGQGCCGALHFHFGHIDEGLELARRNLAAFARYELDAIISNAAGCGAALKEYGEHLETEQARAFSARVEDISEFLMRWDLRPYPPIPPLRVAYDEPCHLVHAQGVSAPPKQLLGAVPGLTLVPFEEAQSCCGAAGIYNLVQPLLASAILERKITAIAAAQPEVVVSGNPGCIFQLRQGMRLAGLAIPVRHPVELLPALGES